MDRKNNNWYHKRLLEYYQRRLSEYFEEKEKCKKLKITDLPADMIREIFDKDPESLLNLSATCKLFHDILKDKAKETVKKLKEKEMNIKDVYENNKERAKELLEYYDHLERRKEIPEKLSKFKYYRNRHLNCVKCLSRVRETNLRNLRKIRDDGKVYCYIHYPKNPFYVGD